MTALVRTARTAPTPSQGVPGRQPVNAMTSGIRVQPQPAIKSAAEETGESVLVSRRKRAKRRALRG